MRVDVDFDTPEFDNLPESSFRPSLQQQSQFITSDNLAFKFVPLALNAKKKKDLANMLDSYHQS
jgi:hypothetical protein